MCANCKRFNFIASLSQQSSRAKLADRILIAKRTDPRADTLKLLHEIVRLGVNDGL